MKEPTYTHIEICEILHISTHKLEDFLEHGLLNDIQDPIFNATDLKRLETACRLERDLDLNIQGVVLALELLDELESLRVELNIYKRFAEPK